MAAKQYTILDKSKQIITVELDDTNSALVVQAESDFNKAKEYIFSREYYIWREWFKLYHLSTKDRKEAIWEDWKSNLASWLTRWFVDIMVSSLQDKPLSFWVKWINKKWFDNSTKIKDVLDYVSDRTNFHTQIKQAYKSWLITWNIAFRVWFKDIKKQEKYYDVIWWEVIEEIIENDEIKIPYAEEVSVFDLFPDPYTWNLRYITERQVLSYEQFIAVYGGLIRDTDNKSKFKNDKFLETLLLNWDLADKQDYWDIVEQIHKWINSDFKEWDSYEKPKNTSAASTLTWDDKELTKSLIEVKATWYKTRLIITANWYPVYIWKNPYWFIPYVYKASDNSKVRFGEWIPYVVWDIDKVKTSSTNSVVDWVRSIANPTIVAQKNLLINEYELEDWTPWGVLYTEDNRNWNAIYALDKWRVTDFGLWNVMTEMWTFKTWVSEYNMWVAAHERTASWALAVVQSSEKRLSPYISAFLDSISIVAEMWLKLIKKYWTDKQMIYILDEDWKQVWEELKKKDIMWGVNITLQAEWMVWVNEALRANKLQDLFNTLAPSWFVNADKIAKELIKTNGFNPDKFMTAPWQWVKPDNAEQIANQTAQTWLPWKNKPTEAQDLWNQAWQAVTPNSDLGNKWQWQQ